MRKKDKLYTVNRWNKPLFIPEENLFATAGQMNTPNTAPMHYFGITPKGTYKPDNTPIPKIDTSGYVDKFGTGKGITGVGKKAWGAAGEAALTAGAGIVGNLANKGISGGMSSGAGEAIGSLGSTVGSAVGAVNPLLGAAITVGSGIIGGGVNALFGEKVDTKRLAEANESIGTLNSFNGDVDSFDDIQGPQAVGSVNGIFQGGVFNSSAEKKQKELEERMRAAKQFADRSVVNNVSNLTQDQINDSLANYSAFGGPLDMVGYSDNMGALGYGLMSDYLTMKKRQNDVKNKMTGITPVSTFALGGDLQINGGDWSTGLSHISAGLSHEESPYDGVQMGIDPQGVPNLVEENETVFDDYVYSARIQADQETLKKFHLPKKAKLTYAEISKKLEKEISERPNDPISIAGFKAQMHDLADEQERQKAEMEAARAREAFEALSPEEQTALMQRAAEEEQMAQEQAMQQEAMTQQPSLIEQQEQVNPEEAAMIQQQQMADGSQAMIGQEPQMSACGGKINRFDNGGQAYNKMINSLGFHTQKEFEDWAKENNIDFGDIWKNTPNILNSDILGGLWENENFKEALRKKNPALFHAFDTKGYDFGAYKSTDSGKATVQSISKGNWKATNGKGWKGSEDLAFKQATEGLSDAEIDALTTEQLAERMRNTEAYKNTNKWLENADNALLYLNTLYNDPNTPQVAKDYAAKYIKDGKWKDGFNYDYATVFGSNGKGVRETNPGTYWHTAMEANRGNQTGNFVINDDGTVEEIIGDVPSDWVSAGSYVWANPENDYSYNYYKKPTVAAPASETPPTGTAETENPEDQNKIVPVLQNEGLRYAGLYGPLAGLGMMAAGIGKPDYSALDAAVAKAGNVHLAKYKPLGDYMTYKPLDIWYEQNRLNANARATDRQIMNSGANQGSKIAGLLASGYNDQLASGNLFRQAQEYNDALKKQVTEFNRGTNQYNSDQYGATSRFNASALNEANRASAQLGLHAAQEKLEGDSGWYNSLYGNVNQFFKGMSDLGRERADRNWIARLAASGAIPGITPDGAMNAGLVQSLTPEQYEKWKKKQNKRRGFTFG